VPGRGARRPGPACSASRSRSSAGAGSPRCCCACSGHSARVTVVRRRPEPLAGAVRTVGDDRLHEALGSARAVVLVLVLTPRTLQRIGRAELAAMDQDAWLVNVARGKVVDTKALVEALRSGQIGGAALDVTDPEPLPAGHPLWDLPNCLITPHTADTEEMTQPLLARRITENIQRLQGRIL
jgi:phosphoglycerate dehydrogenase-like enzyme